MFQSQTYVVALSLMLVSMIFWRSWANTIKARSEFRFQLFYWDYALGLIFASVLWGITLGSFGASVRPSVADLLHADGRHIVLALIGGAIFNISNLLLFAAIQIAGLAVAFPAGIGLALGVGAGSSYVLSPGGDPLLLFGGIALVFAVGVALSALPFNYLLMRRPLTVGEQVSFRGYLQALRVASVGHCRWGYLVYGNDLDLRCFALA